MASCLAAMLLSGCVTPAVNAQGYHGKLRQSAKKMAGIIGAARLAAQLDLDGKMLYTVTDNVVTNAEDDAQSVVNSLDSVQPPDAGTVQLRTSAGDVLQTAAGELADLRIALRRGDQAAMRSAIADLTKTLGNVQHLQDVT